MLSHTVWRRALVLDDATVIDRIEHDEAAEVVVVHVHQRQPSKLRCGVCGNRVPRYDRGRRCRRRWRAPDVGMVKTFLEADTARVRCPEHGVVVAQVPWARHNTGHTRAFDDCVAWLVTQASKTAVSVWFRVAWVTVGAIIARVVADLEDRPGRFDGVRRIGIDEISYKRGHKYLTVVVDHDTRRLLWAAPGRDEKTLAGFFELIGPKRCRRLRYVSADAAPWIKASVSAHCPNAKQGADPFHIVKWANQALDEVRRQVWNDARRHIQLPIGREARRARQHTALPIKKARWALWKNPEDLSDHQREQLAWIAATHPLLFRAYELKEALRAVFRLRGKAAKQALDRWLIWAQRCRIPAFVDLARRIRRHRDEIHVTLETGLSNGLIESTNSKMRLLARMAFGFKNPEALVALAMLALGGYRPDLPGRA